MISPSLTRVLPESLGNHGPLYLRGQHTCAGVVSVFFKHNHLQLARYASALHVAEVRVSKNIGLVILVFGGIPARQTEVIHEQNVWRMYTLADSELP
jgi:hypothetical protein